MYRFLGKLFQKLASDKVMSRCFFQIQVFNNDCFHLICSDFCLLQGQFKTEPVGIHLFQLSVLQGVLRAIQLKNTFKVRYAYANSFCLPLFAQFPVESIIEGYYDFARIIEVKLHFWMCGLLECANYRVCGLSMLYKILET